MARYQPRDSYYWRARDRGLPSRAAFKLDELLARHRLVRPGARVIDLGCAPGGWLAVLGAAVGSHGLVVGIDLSPTRAVSPNVITLSGDLVDPAIRAEAVARMGGQADLITSDLSPKLTGIADRDQVRSAELLNVALEFAHTALKPGGAMVAKAFMGAAFGEVAATFRRRFASVELARPRASRPGSAEIYLVATGFQPAPD
jgi:23S rRNA (uridine2552-2'-O)-methyltransferase